MARLVGIDIQAHHLRIAVLQTQYSGVKVLGLAQAPIASRDQLVETLQELGLPLVQQTDHLSTIVGGDQLFLRDIDLPAAAAKQLNDVVPYEIEAQVPLEFDDLCFDYRLLERSPGKDSLKVLAAACRTTEVRKQIEVVQSALGSEPERVAAGPIVLANLARVVVELRDSEPVALLNVGLLNSDLVVLVGGHPAFARTLSVGAEAGPEAVVAALRQSQAAWLSRGAGPFRNMFLTGAERVIEGAAPVLSRALGYSVAPLPAMEVARGDGVGVDMAGYEKAIAAALGLASGARGLNLRRGPLQYHHSYEFIKTKLPAIAALAGLIVASFAFSVWAQARSLASENASLEVALSGLSQEAFGERIEDADEIIDRLERGEAAQEVDPQSKLDAFDVLVEVSKAIEPAIIHDMDEFEVKGEKVNITGIVSTIDEAKRIESAMAERDCFQEVKIGKITKVVNGDRQKYSLAFEVRCETSDGATLARAQEGARP